MNKELLNVGAAYIRVSDARQDEYSPDSQIKKVREYAAKDGYLIPDEYVFYDDGISGRDVKKRDDFNRMIAMAREKNHPFDVIYVWKFSRFARNQEQAIVYKNLLRKSGVSVVSVSEPIPEGAFGSLIERIIEWMDQFYSQNLATEVVRGMTEKISRGEPVTTPPYGYVIRDKQYFPDTDSGAADVVRDVFERYARGEKMRDIAVTLGMQGVRTKSGNLPEIRWIEYMLNNPCYIGCLRWSKDGTQAVHKRNYDDESVMTVQGNHTPIIPLDLWEKAQEMLKAQKLAYPKKARKHEPVKHYLKGILRCSSCGGTLTINNVSAKNKQPWYQCNNYARGVCQISHSVVTHKIEDAFVTALEMAAQEKQFKLVPAPSSKTEKADIDFNKLIAIEQRRLERAKEAYLAEIDTIEQYSQNKAEIAARIKELNKLREKDAAKNFDPDAFAKRVAKLVKIIKSPKVSHDAKNEAIRAIVNKVVYDKPNSHISIFFHTL